ncbi:hypothetical protein HKD37_02G004911 [Glycine soja]
MICNRKKNKWKQKEIWIKRSPNHVAPLPPKKSSKSVISSSSRASSASSGASAGGLFCLGLRPISRPCDLCPELVRSRARKRSKALALQAETHLIKTIMGLYMCPVVRRLLANQMPANTSSISNNPAGPA